MIDNASEVQGECRAELARAMLSRSLHSYPQLLDCGYKGTNKIDALQTFLKLFLEFFLKY